MPRDRIRTLVMSAEKDAVKRFLSHMHQTWDQLQVETGQVVFKRSTKQQESTLIDTLYEANCPGLNPPVDYSSTLLRSLMLYLFYL